MLEANERAGGLIATIRRNGFLFEVGPQCPRFPSSVWRIVQELGLESEFVAADRYAKRYVLRRGRLHVAPLSPWGLVTTRLVGLTSKFRILSEVFRTSYAPDHEESLAEFVHRKFGAEILDNLVDPFVSTIFFGDCCKMGMESAFPALIAWERNQGSLVRGAIQARKCDKSRDMFKRFAGESHAGDDRRALHVTDAFPPLGSFTSGMGTLPERLEDELRTDIRYKTSISFLRVLRNETDISRSRWKLECSGGETITAEHLVLAVPAYVAAELTAGSLPQLASPLRAIEYAPLRAVSFVYDRCQIAHPLKGFGFMAPRREGVQVICTFWNSSLFPHRVPKNKVLMTSFARSGVAGATGEQEWPQVVEVENARILGITGAAVDRLICEDARALPQYTVGHAGRVAAIDSILRSLPNLHLTGNYLRGRSIGDCLDLAFQTADNLHNRLRSEDI